MEYTEFELSSSDKLSRREKNFFAVVRGISSFSSNKKYDDRRGGGSSTIDPSVKNIFNYLGSSIEEL